MSLLYQVTNLATYIKLGGLKTLYVGSLWTRLVQSALYILH